MDARILLVEDDPSIREITAIGLRGAGFSVISAADGREGLARFRADSPDLVLLDVMLPGLDGLEVAREIRRDSTVPIVMLIARGDTLDVVVGLEAGADDYVRKPFELPELVARVRAALRRGRGGLAGVDHLRLGPLAIDVAARTVTRDGAPIPLTRTEFDVLVELARRPGLVVTRDVLLERVWGYDAVGTAIAPGVGGPGASGPGVSAANASGPDGPGMDLERLFERFAKADPARPGGSGLGLAIARARAELLGGSLRATAEPDGGLRFELRLDVTESLRAGDEAVMDDPDRETRSEPARSPRP